MALLSGLLKLLSSSTSGTAAGNCISSSASTSGADLESSTILCGEFLLVVYLSSLLMPGPSSSAALSSSAETSTRLSSTRSRIRTVESASVTGKADGDALFPCILTIVLWPVDEVLPVSESEEKGTSAISCIFWTSFWLGEDCLGMRCSSRSNGLLSNSAL